MNNSFNIIALDKDYNIVSLLRYTNLQWSRKYTEPGTFSIRLPLEQYKSNFAYIYTKDRPEMGKINQVNYISGEGFKFIQISGYFLEKELDRMICYPISVSNIRNAPTWATRTGKLESIAHYFFNNFRSLTTANGKTSTLDVVDGVDNGKGETHTVERGVGEYLGKRIYEILSLDGMSYRVSFDFINLKKIFGVWQGRNRTENNPDGNNPVIFSTKYGNIKYPNVLIDDSMRKNAEMILSTDFKTNTVYMRAIWNRQPGEDSSTDIFYLHNGMTFINDFETEPEFIAALEEEGMNDLSGRIQTINVEFDTQEGSYDYMEDFDLGDKCNIEIPEIGLAAEARLIGCYEVVKGGVWTLSLEFGSPVIK